MSLTWSKELKAKIPLPLVMTLQQVPRSEGFRLLGAIEMTDDEREQVLLLCRPDAPLTATERGQWIAAAWVCGASYRQLSRLHNLSLSTIRDHVARRLKGEERLNESVDDQRLAQMWAVWNRRQQHIPAGASLQLIASMLALATTLDEPPPPPVDWCA